MGRPELRDPGGTGSLTPAAEAHKKLKIKLIKPFPGHTVRALRTINLIFFIIIFVI